MSILSDEHFPDLGSWSEQEVRSVGYHRCSVSVFDHWLTPEEASACSFLSYHDAVSAGLSEAYEAQELRFLSFYQTLFAGGVYRRAGVGRTKTSATFHQGWDRRLKKDVKRSLRDHRHMDVYIPALSLRIAGSWDRSDALLFENAELMPAVAALAVSHGLFII